MYSYWFVITGGHKSRDEGVQITWDNPEELEVYIRKLQQAADNLTSENRRLRKCHFTICEKVQNLEYNLLLF